MAREILDAVRGPARADAELALSTPLDSLAAHRLWEEAGWRLRRSRPLLVTKGEYRSDPADARAGMKPADSEAGRGS